MRKDKKIIQFIELENLGDYIYEGIAFDDISNNNNFGKVVYSYEYFGDIYYVLNELIYNNWTLIDSHSHNCNDLYNNENKPF